MNNISSSGKTILALLNNVGDLVAISNDRKSAEEVMKASVIYAKSQGISLPEDKINTFFARLYDARPQDIRTMSLDIGKAIMNKEIEKLRKMKK